MMNARVEARMKQAGRIGCRQGMSEKDNPFAAGTAMHEAWSAGWKEQKAAMRQGQAKAAKQRSDRRKKASGAKGKAAKSGKNPGAES